MNTESTTTDTDKLVADFRLAVERFANGEDVDFHGLQYPEGQIEVDRDTFDKLLARVNRPGDRSLLFHSRTGMTEVVAQLDAEPMAGIDAAIDLAMGEIQVRDGADPADLLRAQIARLAPKVVDPGRIGDLACALDAVTRSAAADRRAPAKINVERLRNAMARAGFVMHDRDAKRIVGFYLDAESAPQ